MMLYMTNSVWSTIQVAIFGVGEFWEFYRLSHAIGQRRVQTSTMTILVYNLCLRCHLVGAISESLQINSSYPGNCRHKCCQLGPPPISLRLKRQDPYLSLYKFENLAMHGKLFEIFLVFSRESCKNDGCVLIDVKICESLPFQYSKN